MTDITRELDVISKDVVSQVKKASKKLSQRRLLDVATISSNNDKSLGRLIADTYTHVGGKHGVVLVDRSKTQHTYAEIIKGIRIDKGYSSPMFINEHRRDECVLEDAYVLVSDGEISSILDIEKILGNVLTAKKKLLIIAPCSTNVINTLAANVQKNRLKVCVVQPPSFGYRQHELMSDIAVSVGATFFSEKTGDDLSLIDMQDLGRASKVIASKDSTVVMRDDVIKEVSQRIDELWGQHDEADKKEDKEFIKQRIASLSGGIGMIFVGGTTDMEQKEKFDRVDDAVCAVRVALIDGIVPGGGVMLAKIALTNSKSTIASNAMREALLTPMRQIYINAGIPPHVFYKNRDLAIDNEGLDLKTGSIGNMIKMGVIDPSKVTQEAVMNAVSVANTILSTNAIVTLARSYE